MSLCRIIAYSLPFALLVYGFHLSSCTKGTPKKVMLDVTRQPYEKLSDYGFFKWPLADLKPNDRVIPYELITPLFTDYAFKARFVYVPEGKSVVYDTSQVLQFPVGSCLIKNFYYPEDFSKPEGKRRIIETRLLVHRQSGWEALDYIWNEEQTEAFLENTGALTEVSWKHYDGNRRTSTYIVPNKNQCKSCHWRNDLSAITPIGPKVRNLNCNLRYTEGEYNQLVYWTKAGILQGAPAPDACPKIADWADKTRYNVNERARAYLEVNCGHCHSPNGPAYTSGLHLNLENTNPENLGVCKPPVAAGKATGGRLYGIVPGKPDASIMVHRMESEDPGVKMPEVGKNLVHTEGVALIREWITSMPANAPCAVN
ncbi:MAG: hypothetical protein NZM35_02075 [Chitinophagales bacterium]|nr:hypothetical protein [Chitinophagales bacterium]MDW8418324.1 SO2930 family diheme c-type cytochrome [Chitinophagales bacterium]